MMRARIIAILSALVLTGVSSVAAAQVVCKPGKGCTLELPTGTWQSPQVGGQAGGQVGGQGQTQLPTPHVDPNLQWKLEMERRARWQAYFDWRVQVKLKAEASINVRGEIERYKAEAWRTPDPYATRPPPLFVGAGEPPRLFPRVDLGFLTACFGLYSGKGTPTYTGYCPAIRYRFNKKWGIAFDPAYVSADHGGREFGMVGLRPGVEYSFAHGKDERAASHGYAVAGLDLWIPTTSRDYTPSVFLGGHVGLGAMFSWSVIGVGAELRGLVRGGLGNQENALAHEMSSFRVGFEVRVPTLYVSF
ncbi:hypothetical protein [Polyangium aurulentum]|uniref:hypothetical protein n=1 Tax=Polyangium aurulentum TaxID=2567896 RepID=UPI0010AED820|nr:hypothetical protein [Polyangium aurulentum]UQA58365.1 hypothetical protein E8A73_045160 [Polyangium aurulentum]